MKLIAHGKLAFLYLVMNLRNNKNNCLYIHGCERKIDMFQSSQPTKLCMKVPIKYV